MFNVDSRKNLTAIIVATGLLTACGNSGQTADEAYVDEASRVGY